ncbi:MAG: SHOCT domain-containing protein [Haloferula sp.]
MSIASELEKLTALRNRGDLSEAEFTKAKAVLLAGENSEGSSSPPTEDQSESGRASPDPSLAKRRNTQLLIAIFATVAAIFSSISAVIAPSGLKIAILILWVVASVSGWISYQKIRNDSMTRD